MKRGISRRRFLSTGAAAAAGVALGDNPPGKAAVKRRVVILGFDGVEPSIVDEMLSRGELPHLDLLRKRGNYQRLRSTIPPQSPTAWNSFATCKNPGQHGIYDFLRRDPKNYLPGVALGTTKHPELAPDGSVSRPAHFASLRKGNTFWTIADGRGGRCKILSMPFSFPPDELLNGRMLCSLGVPDIRGTTSTFFSLSDAFTADQLKQRLSGGMRLLLEFEEDTAIVKIPGARDPRQKRATYVEVPVEISVDRPNHKTSVKIQGQVVDLAENTWSDWIEWMFTVTPKHAVRALSRIYALEVGDQVRLYMTCLQFHPQNPYIPFTCPKSYSADLADRYGLYKTVGWAYDTHALRQDAMTEDVFLDDVERTMSWRETLTLEEMDRENWDLLIAVWTATDRVGHMFWRFRDPLHPLYTDEGAKKYGRALENTYKKMDTIVGKVTARLRDNDLLIVMSDHGFHSFRKGFNVNTWLIREGYLAVRGKYDSATAYNEESFLRGYDWSRTKAYGLGLGSIYLNLRGREGQGTIEPQEASSLRTELQEKLLQVTDPETEEKIFRGVYTRDVYHGAAMADAPDIELGYVAGYQSTKSAAKGAAPPELFELNTDKWSGEHVASDVGISSGVLFANRKLSVDPAIIDLGVTALEYLGVPVPDDFEGKSLV